MAARARIGLVCDLAEENWPSMDLVAEMLFENLRTRHSDHFTVERIRPPFRRRASRIPRLRDRRAAHNFDRVLNRFVDYPRAIRRRRKDFDLFHVIDHTYAHLVRDMPPGRAIVTCHDTEAFRPLLHEPCGPRARLMASMARRILDGMRRAEAIACVSCATIDELVRNRFVTAAQVTLVPNGTHPDFTSSANPAADAEAARLLGAISKDRPELLNVGSTVARKRIDILLRVVAAVRGQMPNVRLVRVGGALTNEQARLADKLGVSAAIVHLPFVSTAVLSAVYRRAAALIVTSEAEGFCLPIAEALACGTAVVASDLPATRETGGEAVRYVPVGEVGGYARALLEAIDERRESARSEAGLQQAAKFSWDEHTKKICALYRSVL
jgi:glycosyltransferase involved in cell wall biosynthesis